MVKLYHGITHYVPIPLAPLWAQTLCRVNMHLFDEVIAWSTPQYEHYLHCDACGLVVHIDKIEPPTPVT